MKHKNRKFLLSMVVCIAITFSACGLKTTSEDTILWMNYYHESNIQESKFSADDLLCRLMPELAQAWQQENQELVLEEKLLRRIDYGSEITSYGALKQLPDVFFLSVSRLPMYVENDLLLDITDICPSNPVSLERMAKGTLNGRVYGFPLPTANYVLIAYYAPYWQEQGFHEFPKTWEELMALQDKMAETDEEPSGLIGVSGKVSNAIASEFFPKMVEEYFPSEKLAAWKANEPGNDFFVTDSMKQVLQEITMLAENGILLEATSATEAYSEGLCPAIILQTNEIPFLQETELWEDTRFARIPVSKNSPFGSEALPKIYGTGENVMVLNAKVAENPKKLEACLDFCEFMSADKNLDRYEFYLTESHEADSAMKSYRDCVKQSVNGHNILLETNANVQSQLYAAIEKLLAGTYNTDSKEKYSQEEIANMMQNGYETYRDSYPR